MTSLDNAIAGLGDHGFAMALVVALLLGLRHATDPDHLTAVSTLVMAEGEDGARRAGRLGLAWGTGHAVTLLLFGMPLVIFRSAVPEAVQRAAEITIGLAIAALALRLLVRWRRGYFHLHPHRHGERWHAHPHAHEREPEHDHPPVHAHAHPESLGRSPLTAFGIGLVHGVGGSAAVGLLLVGAVPGRGHAALALVLFAAATAASMASLSTALGRVLGRAAVGRRTARLIPAMGTLSLAFGVWYVAVAL